MLTIRQLFGKKSESLAASYLKKSGYTVLETNHRNKLGEIDIIAVDGEVIVFVEVKGRRSLTCGTPKAAVDYRKQRTISKVALLWLKTNKKTGVKARFDVVSIFSDNYSTTIELIKNAFELQYR